MPAEEVVLKPKRRQTDAELDITPMIDIVFLLLAFFVVASKMDPKAVTDLPFAKNGNAIFIKESVVLVVIAEGEGVRVYGGEKKEREFKGSDDELKDQITEYVRTTIDADPRIKTVVVKAEREIANKYVQPVFQAAKEAAPEFEIRAAVEEKK
jgi:biopolymer transport protein ExbD